MARPIHLLSSVSVSGSRGATEPPEPSAPPPPPPSTALGPLAVPQNQQQPQFQYLSEYDWTPSSASVSYFPLFTPADQHALPFLGVSRPFSSHEPTSESPFPLLGAGMLPINPNGPTPTPPVSQASLDSQKDGMAREPSVPPPSIRKSSRVGSGSGSGERGPDRDSTGDDRDRDAVEDVPAAAVADPSVSRIRRTWASIYEDDVLTSDECVCPPRSLPRISTLSDVDLCMIRSIQSDPSRRKTPQDLHPVLGAPHQCYPVLPRTE